MACCMVDNIDLSFESISDCVDVPLVDAEGLSKLEAMERDVKPLIFVKDEDCVRYNLYETVFVSKKYIARCKEILQRNGYFFTAYE